VANKRIPARPPELPGYTLIKLIGTGGHADVFLYEQHLPRRQVAVKVLIADAAAGAAQRLAFAAEANLMARVSAHPFIVPIFQADIAPDGRPYLVMEYYPGENFYERAKHGEMTVADVLRTGVQLASAVETAHRVGILHRDIKPANILTSAFARPGLTDFGIASVQGHEDEATEGLSIPWSPPESFGDGLLDPRSDVYSLAATIYTLLCGRSPFEVPGGDNSGSSMISRIERSPLLPTGRADVPASFERLLAHAMAKDPARRPATAIEFAHLLQRIESELGVNVTAVELADDHQPIRSSDAFIDDDSTRIKGITEVKVQALAAPLIDGLPQSLAGSPSASARLVEGLGVEPVVGNTIPRAKDRLVSTPAADRSSSDLDFGIESTITRRVGKRPDDALILDVLGTKSSGLPRHPGSVTTNQIDELLQIREHSRRRTLGYRAFLISLAVAAVGIVSLLSHSSGAVSKSSRYAVIVAITWLVFVVLSSAVMAISSRVRLSSNDARRLALLASTQAYRNSTIDSADGSTTTDGGGSE
jgi:serine/threonine protein kinase